MTELMTWGPLCENKFKPTVFRASHQELPDHTHAIRINKRPHRQRRVAWPRCVYGLVVWAVAAARHAEACLENSAPMLGHMAPISPLSAVHSETRVRHASRTAARA